MGDAIAGLLTKAFTDPASVMAEVDGRPAYRHSDRAMPCCERRQRLSGTSSHVGGAVASRGAGARSRRNSVTIASKGVGDVVGRDADVRRRVRSGAHVADRSVASRGRRSVTALSHRAGILRARGRHREASRRSSTRSLHWTIDRPSLEADVLANRGVLTEARRDERSRGRHTTGARRVPAWAGTSTPLTSSTIWRGWPGDEATSSRHCGDSICRSDLRVGRCPAARASRPLRDAARRGLAQEALALAKRSAASLATEVITSIAPRHLLVARAAILAGEPARALAAAEEASSYSPGRTKGPGVGCRVPGHRVALAGGTHRGATSNKLSASPRRRRPRGCTKSPSMHGSGGGHRCGPSKIGRRAVLPFDPDQTPVGLAARFRVEHLRGKSSAARGEHGEAIAMCAAALDSLPSRCRPRWNGDARQVPSMPTVGGPRPETCVRRG